MTTTHICTDLSDKSYASRHGKFDDLGGVMVSTLTRNARDVGSILVLDTIFPTHPCHIHTQRQHDAIYIYIYNPSV